MVMGLGVGRVEHEMGPVPDFEHIHGGMDRIVHRERVMTRCCSRQYDQFADLTVFVVFMVDKRGEVHDHLVILRLVCNEVYFVGQVDGEQVDAGGGWWHVPIRSCD